MKRPDVRIPAAAAGLFVVSGLSFAAPLGLAEKPLITAVGVKPNIMLIIDDSGSTDSEVLFPTNDGALWWNTNDSSFTGRDQNDSPSSSGTLNFNAVGTASSVWKKYVYLFPIGTGAGNRVYSDSTNDHYAVPPTGPLAFARSADYNGMYYDPAQTYSPWVSDGEYSFSNMSASAADADPVRGGNALDLTADKESSSANWTFRFHPGMVIPNGTRYRDWETGDWKTADADVVLTDSRNVAVSYFPATYYSKLTSGSFTVATGELTATGDCADPNPALYAGYVGAPGTLASDSVDALAPDGACLEKHEIRDGNTFPSGRTYAAELQNFANWYSYYRKRHLALRAGAGKAFDEITNVRTGGFRINSRSLQGMWDIDTQRSSLYSFLYTAVGSGGTPNREALKYAGEQFDTNSDVITHSCQQNFALLFTDGFSNAADAGIGNADGDKGAPYADSYSGTMADIAMKYFASPLRTADFPPSSSPGVPIPSACGRPDTPAWLDCNSKLHMVTYGITLGAKGHLFGVSYSRVRDAYVSPPAWAEPNLTRNPVQVDDLYHATVNGRGEILNAGNAIELQQALSSALESIIARTNGSSAAASTNTGYIGTNSRFYQARYNSADWTGQLLAFAVESDPESPAYGLPLTNGSGPDGSLWDAGTELPGWNARTVLTHNGTEGVPFRWDQLSTAQQTNLGSEGILNYLRGSSSGEGTIYRARNTGLGDLVNSSPVFVGAPSFRYPDSLESGPRYSEFKEDNEGRTGMIYVGGNDGMLHGFNATTGAETLAYVPARLFGKLGALASTSYSHQYYVDGSPTVIDAVVDDQWKSILAGGLNQGGQGVYALDVTDPSAFSESNAASIVMWEFTDADDADLGYTFSQPAVVKLQNGAWAAIFGNGYNSTEADGSTSTTGNAVLYVVNLETGALIRKISTQTGMTQDPTGQNRPNGLATVAAVDLDGDFRVDVAYAGDLFGNLWKFDLSDANPSQWDIAFESGSARLPLFTACAGDSCTTGVSSNRQPITSRPSVGRHPSGRGAMVYFGTGKYLETGDNNAAAGGVQSFYAVWDRDARVSGRSSLLEQEITHEFTRTFGSTTHGLRVTSNHPLSWNTHLGWYIDLISPVHGTQGERQVTNSVLRNNKIIFTTTIPTEDPCLPGGTSWLMEMDATSGSRLTYTPFDLNNDRRFSESDFVTVEIEGEDGETETIVVPASGIQTRGGDASTPTVMGTDDGETKCISSAAGMECLRENPGPRDTGRQSWRQLGR